MKNLLFKLRSIPGIAILGCFLFFPSPAMADKTVSLTWTDIVRLVDNHPRFSAARIQIEGANQGVRATEAVPNPTLEGNAGQGFPRGGGDPRLEWGLSLTMPLDWIAARGVRKEQALADVDSAVAQTRVLRRDVLLTLHTLFWTLVSDQARIDALTELEKHTANLVSIVHKRVETGEARPIEALRVEIEFEKLGIELEEARGRIFATQKELASWCGLPPDQQIVAQADLDASLPQRDQTSVLQEARDANPSLEAAKALTRSAMADVDAEKKARVPAFDVNGFYSSELDRTAWGLALSIELPLWNWNSAAIAQAEAHLAETEIQTDIAGIESDRLVEQIQNKCVNAARTAARYKEQVLPRSKRVAATVEKSYALGESNLIEVIDARRTLTETTIGLLDALTAAQIECNRLQTLVEKEAQ